MTDELQWSGSVLSYKMNAILESNLSEIQRKYEASSKNNYFHCKIVFCSNFSEKKCRRGKLSFLGFYTLLFPNHKIVSMDLEDRMKNLSKKIYR